MATRFGTCVLATLWGAWLLCVGTIAAQPKADSLRARMRASHDLATYAALLHELTEESRIVEIDSVAGWANQLLEIGKQLNDPGIQSDGYAHLAWLNRVFGNAEVGIRNAELALDMADMAQDPSRKANALYEVAIIQREQGRLDEAHTVMRRALEAYRADANHLHEARCLNAIGEFYRLQGQLDSALYHYALAEPLFAKEKYIVGTLIVRNNRGLVLNAQENYAAAIDTLLPVNTQSCDLGFEAIYFESANAMAIAYLALKDYESALKYAKLAYSRSYLLGYKTYTRDAAQTLYDVYLAEQNYQMALCYLMQHYEIANDIVNEASQNHIRSLNYDLQLKDKEGEIALLKKDRQIRQLLVVLAVIGLGLTLLIGLILFAFYRRKQRDNKLLESQNERLAGLVREKDGLINVVAHDLKSPIHKSKALLDLLREDQALTPKQAQVLTMVQRSLDDGERLIRDLLDISQSEDNKMTLHPTEFDLGQLVSGLVSSHAEAARKKRIELVVPAAAPSLPLFTDESFVARIFDNLLSNAVKYSPANSSVHIGYGQGNGKSWFSVKDNGPGFSAEDQEKMYQKFQRLSARPTGGESSNGLGLAIIRMLLGHLGGDIELKSELGKGSEFVVTFPTKAGK